MNMYKRLSFAVKSIITASALILLVGIVLIISSIVIQKKVLTSEMEGQAVAIAERWGKDIDIDLVEEAVKKPDFEEKVQKELTAYFDNISYNNPNIAQSYIFGTELVDGNKTKIIATPSNIIELLKENDVALGDLWENPVTITKSIEELNETKEISLSDIYDDEFGTWVTVLYPIKNKSGEVFAFFATDIDASMVKDGSKTFLLNSLLILIPSIIIVVLLQVFTVRRNTVPLKHLLEGINEMRKGNLDINLPTREDDLGMMNEAFNDMALELKTMIINIQETSNTVLNSSELVNNVTANFKMNIANVSDNISQMASGIQTQETSVEESATAIGQIASEIEEIANSSNEISIVSKDMESHAIEGLSSIHNVIAQMETINDTVKESSEIIISLKQRSDQISSILDVISEISSQTNLLALNAAIEAARAGEHGKGFAVVAQEVRKLAEESNTSTGDIARIIEEIQTETNNAVSSMVIGTREAEKGTEIARITGELFVKIEQYTVQITNQIEGVSAASQEISAGSEEVTASVQELTSIAHQNTNLTKDIEKSSEEQLDSVNQLSDAAIELNDLAQELESMITRFNA